MRAMWDAANDMFWIGGRWVSRQALASGRRNTSQMPAAHDHRDYVESRVRDGRHLLLQEDCVCDEFAYSLSPTEA